MAGADAKKAPVAGSVNVLPAMGVADVITGSLLGGIFLGLALVDASVALAENAPQLLPHYLQWKTSNAMPIISHIMLVLVLLLPFEIFRAVKEDVLGLVYRPAGWARHTAGTAAFLMLVTLVTVLVTQVTPLEQAVVAAGAPADAGAIASLSTLYVLLVGANVFNAAMAVTKYWASQVPGAPLPQGADASGEQKKQQ